MTGFTKPTTLVRKAEVAVRQAVGAHVPADPRRGFTDHMEVLSPQLVIGYKKYPAAANYPSDAMKASAQEATRLAARIMRKVNDEFAGILMLRRKESALMQQVLATHFHLIAGDTAGGMLKDNVVNKKFSAHAVFEKDRRWVLERIRQNMLSLSFHLNTGVYLIDTDPHRRDIETGQVKAPVPVGTAITTEAYVSPTKTKFDPNTWRVTGAKFYSDTHSGFRNGEIHVSLELLKDYSALSYARIIIHEATHKYFNTEDEAYAHQGTYAGLSLVETLNNADSYAWAAVSLYAGAVKMGSLADYNRDWAQCS
jgi:diadenosine tetraphosphate (Ap4A) HIT family hydrolase